MLLDNVPAQDADKHPKRVADDHRDKGTDQDNVIASRIPGQLDGQPHPLLLIAQKFYEGVIGGAVKVDYAQQGDEAAKGDGAEVKDKHF